MFSIIYVNENYDKLNGTRRRWILFLGRLLVSIHTGRSEISIILWICRFPLMCFTHFQTIRRWFEHRKVKRGIQNLRITGIGGCVWRSKTSGVNIYAVPLQNASSHRTNDYNNQQKFHFHLQVGTCVPIDVVNYTPETNRCTLRCPASFYVRFRAALTLTGEFENQICCFNVHKASKHLKT